MLTISSKKPVWKWWEHPLLQGKRRPANLAIVDVLKELPRPEKIVELVLSYATHNNNVWSCDPESVRTLLKRVHGRMSLVQLNQIIDICNWVRDTSAHSNSKSDFAQIREIVLGMISREEFQK